MYLAGQRRAQSFPKKPLAFRLNERKVGLNFSFNLTLEFSTLIPKMQRMSLRFRGVLSLALLLSAMILTGCGKSAAEKEVPKEEKEEMRQELRDMSNREQSGK